MIPAIGLMIAAYVFTRMAELLSLSTTASVVKVLAVLTMLVTIVSTIDLVLSGSPSLPGLP